MRDAKPKPPALKPYLESLKEQCGRLSKEKLTEVLLGLAKETPLEGRAGFLETINRLSQAPAPVSWDDGILSEIEELKRDIRARLASIENGTFYAAQQGHHDRWEHHHTIPEELSEQQRELLDRPGNGPEDHSQHLSDYTLGREIREVRARYARCIYETTPPPYRLPALKSVMKLEGHLSRGWLDVYENRWPMLEDVMEALPGELPDRGAFLPQWLEALSAESSDRAQILLLEAAFLVEGMDGVRSRVRGWGSRQPLGWLFWMHLLALEGDWHGVAAAAAEALPLVDYPHLRARIAEQLAEAGRRLGRADLVLTGQREIFFSAPSDARLIRLVEEAAAQGLREQELERALEFLAADRQSEKTLWVKLLVMTGKLETAFETEAGNAAVGWSDSQSVAGVLFGAVLFLLCHRTGEKADTVRRVLVRYADGGWGSYGPDSGFGDDGEPQTAPAVSISGEILRGLRGLRPDHLSPEQKARYLQWAIQVGRKRIEHIVSNQHRGAYDRAAEVLGALAECFLLNGQDEEAWAIIDEYRNRRYNRHRAFREELDRVIASSTLLQRAQADRRGEA